MRVRLVADVASAAAGLGAVAGGRPVGLLRMLGGLRAGGLSFAGLLAGAAARYPDAVALVDAAGTVTARELDAAADDVARRVRVALRVLPTTGVADDGVPRRPAGGSPRSGGVPAAVGVQVGDHRGFVAAVAGVLRAGADAVLVGPRTGSVALARVVADRGLELLISDGSGGLGGSGGSGGSDGLGTLVIAPTGAGAPPAGRARAPRVVLLTAGTTGPPAVAAVAARRVTTDRLLPQLGLLGASGIRAGRPVLVLAPLFHGHGFAFLAAGLLVGAPVVLAGARSGAEVCAAAATRGVGVVTGVPVHLQRLADHLAAEHPAAEHLAAEHLAAEHLAAEHPAADHAPGDHPCPYAPAPDRVVSGSARLPSGVVDTLTAHLGDVVVDLFGSTQTGVLTVATPADLRAAPGSVGRPVAGVRLAVLDAAGRRCPAGTPGSVALVEGLAGRRRAIPSGDRGAIDRAGRLFLLGRTDDVVVCGGENVRPAEVTELLEAQPGVRAAAVGPVPDVEHGTRLVADVVLVPGGPLTVATAPGALRDAVRAGIGPHAVPRSVRVVDDLRRSAVGKPLPPLPDDAAP